MVKCKILPDTEKTYSCKFRETCKIHSILFEIATQIHKRKLCICSWLYKGTERIIKFFCYYYYYCLKTFYLSVSGKISLSSYLYTTFIFNKIFTIWSTRAPRIFTYMYKIKYAFYWTYVSIKWQLFLAISPCTPAHFLGSQINSRYQSSTWNAQHPPSWRDIH